MESSQIDKCKSKIIVALDFPSLKPAEMLLDEISPEDCRLKVGKEMFTRFGPKWVTRLVDKGFDVFLDLKFHDIPNTVRQACLAAADLGVWMIDVHALGGKKMLEAAVEGVQSFGQARPHIIAITVLTHLSDTELTEVGMSGSVPSTVLRLASITAESGLDGIVCSPQDLIAIKKQLPENFLFITPGVRLEKISNDDQKRIMTPDEAIQSGASYLVIGRPITQADNPVKVIKSINQSLEASCEYSSR